MMQMTTADLLKTLRKSGKPVCLSHLYRLFLVLDIKPVGRARPQIYPASAIDRIKEHLGISAAAVKSRESGGPRQETAHRPAAGKLVSVAQLRAAKPKRKTV